jgi:hypothetical protein
MKAVRPGLGAKVGGTPWRSGPASARPVLVNDYSHPGSDQRLFLEIPGMTASGVINALVRHWAKSPVQTGVTGS